MFECLCSFELLHWIASATDLTWTCANKAQDNTWNERSNSPSRLTYVCVLDCGNGSASVTIVMDQGREVSSGSKEGNDSTFPAWVLTSQWALETWTGHCRQTERKWPLEATRTECHTFAFQAGYTFCVSSVVPVVWHVIDAGALKVALELIFTPYCMSISQTACFDLAIKSVSCTAMTCISTCMLLAEQKFDSSLYSACTMLYCFKAPLHQLHLP